MRQYFLSTVLEICLGGALFVGHEGGPSPSLSPLLVLPPAVIFFILCVPSAPGAPPPHSFNGMSCPRRRRSRRRSQIRCCTERCGRAVWGDRMCNERLFTLILVSVSGSSSPIPFGPKSHSTMPNRSYLGSEKSAPKRALFDMRLNFVIDLFERMNLNHGPL